MSEKRKRDDGDASGDHAKSRKKSKRGFVVGPDNLPDGAYKRKNQKIKTALIQRAQIKKDYEKYKRQGKVPDDAPKSHEPASEHPENDGQEASTAPHPDRQTLIDNEIESPQAEQQQQQHKPPVGEWKRKRKPKSVPFKREYDQAEKRKAETEERRKAREEAERQRQQKLEERERFRKTMAKARSGGPNGQRRLGLESKVLLEKVKRMVGDGR